MTTRLATAIFALALASACGRVDRQIFTGIDNAGRAIAGALDGKTPLPRYRELLGAYTTALATAKARARSSGDRALVAEYEAADNSLHDLLVVWERRDEHDTELLPIAEEIPGRLKTQYDLPVNSNEPPSIYASEALRAIADATRARLQHASDMLK